MRMLAALVLVLPGLAGAAATDGPEAAKLAPPPVTVGTAQPAGPQAPTKGIEEPVFQLPELVIVGENQARIMAQKEALTTSPMRGLHEAPLLEKEEAGVNGLRRRLPPPYPAFTRTGTYAAVRGEGGLPALFGGGLVLGRQDATRLVQLDAAADTIRGEPIPGGRAGGRDLGVGLLAEWAGAPPAWLDRVPFLPAPDLIHVDGGWRGVARDLASAGPTGGVRKADLVSLDADLLAAESGGRTGVVAGWSTLTAPPTGRESAVEAGFSADLLRWTRASWTVFGGGRLHGESATAAGGRVLVGGDLGVAWIPTERWRSEAGLRLDYGSDGGGRFAGSARPTLGIACSLPTGTHATARVGGGLDAPWFARAAVANPYAVMPVRVAPQRTLVEAGLAGWQERRDGGRVGARWEVSRTVDASTWRVRPGEGLFEPAALSRLDVNLFGLNARWRWLRGWSARGEARWRAVTATGGRMANLARGEGEVGVDWAQGPWSAGASV